MSSLFCISSHINKSRLNRTKLNFPISAYKPWPQEMEEARKPGNLKFHKSRSPNVRISQDGKTARKFSPSSGVLFGDRTVCEHEKVNLNLGQTTAFSDGTFRFGFTVHNPFALQRRIQSGCDLHQDGVLLISLETLLIRRASQLSFWFEGGFLRFSIDGIEKGHSEIEIGTVAGFLWPVFELNGEIRSINLLVYQDISVASNHMQFLALNPVEPLNASKPKNVNEVKPRTKFTDLFKKLTFEGLGSPSKPNPNVKYLK